MLNTPLIADHDLQGRGRRHEENLMKRSRELGMQTFDQALFRPLREQPVTYEDALRNADSVNDLRLQIKLNSQRARNRRPRGGHRAPDHRLSPCAGRAAVVSARWLAKSVSPGP